MQRLREDGAWEPPAVERMNTPELEEEKRRGPRNRGLEAVKVRGVGAWGGGVAGHREVKWGALCPPQGQERVRKSSVDLRREIIDVGSIQRLIELRKQRRQRREERAATPEPPPPPEPLEIVCLEGPRVWERGCWDSGWSPHRPAPGSPCQLGTSLGKQGRGPLCCALSCTPAMPQP